MNDKIYLVTGAAGFLGSNICRELVEQGRRVRAFVLPNDKGTAHIPKEVEVVEGNLCDKKSLKNLFDVPANMEIVVIHAASIVTVEPEYNQKVMDVNVGGTKNIVALCQAAANFGKLVYVSSTGCISEADKGVAIREVADFDGHGFMDCYSQSKALATQYVLGEARKGMNACVVHPSGILGPFDYAVGHTTKTLIQIIKGEMPIAINGTFNLCDVRDLAKGIVSASEKGRRGECYILANKAVSFKKFVRIVNRECGVRRFTLFLPGSLAYTLAKRMEKKAQKTGQKPMLTTFAVYNLIRNNVFDSSKAEKELGYTTRSYTETIGNEIQWLKNEKLI